jgi:hypothetical protein
MRARQHRLFEKPNLRTSESRETLEVSQKADFGGTSIRRLSGGEQVALRRGSAFRFAITHPAWRGLIGNH